MREKWALTQDSFEMLLAWLAPEREMAGQKYETIRRRLIKIFYGRGLQDAEELADETINRVARKVNEIAEHYQGDPALYFYGIAQKIHLEARRKKPEMSTNSEPIYQPVFDEHSDECLSRRNCLNKCLVKLPNEERSIVVQYYDSKDQTNINHRNHLAQKLGLTPNTLRVRAFRIRHRLQKCVQDCLQKIET
jgi:RNA polymerase sigma factor (sigma-70 family)